MWVFWRAHLCAPVFMRLSAWHPQKRGLCMVCMVFLATSCGELADMVSASLVVSGYFSRVQDLEK